MDGVGDVAARAARSCARLLVGLLIGLEMQRIDPNAGDDDLAVMGACALLGINPEWEMTREA